jgi:hypothetical protein
MFQWIRRLWSWHEKHQDQRALDRYTREKQGPDEDKDPLGDQPPVVMPPTGGVGG